MKLKARVILVVAILAGGLIGQFALRRHLEAAGPLPEVPLAKALVELPQLLGDWQGYDRAIEDPKLLYADEHLQRTYIHAHRGQIISLWLAYSGSGVDRGHHPEVCMAVAGQPEDPQARQTISVPGHEAPVQQYRFGRPGSFQWVYYWHYTLPPPPDSNLDSLQQMYQRMRRRPSSVTIEAFAPETSPEDAEFASEFVTLVDRAIQEHLGPTAVRGSERLPVTVIDVN